MLFFFVMIEFKWGEIMSCVIRIQESLPILTETDKMIGDYILEHRVEVLNASTQKLANLTKTSPSAIIRFSKKIGFTGFPQLKIELAKDVSNESAKFDDVLDPDEDMSSLIKKTYQANISTIKKTYGLIDVKHIEKAIELLVNAKNIYLFGIGGSGTVCEDFQHKLLRIGKTAIYYQDSHSQLTAVPNMTEDDLGFIVSYSGKTKEMVTAAKWMKKEGVTSIAITQSTFNEVGKLVDLALTIPSEEKELRIGATSSRLSSLIIVDLLYYGLARIDKDNTYNRIIKTRQIIDEIQK